MELFTNFRKTYLQSAVPMPYKKYRTLIFIVPIAISATSFSAMFFLINYYNLSLYLLFFPVFATICSIFLMVIYPYDRKRMRKRNINLNLPYALSYMASISETGVSPVAMFESMGEFDVYEEMSKEAASIVKQTKIVGKDMISALEGQADRTPSDDLKEVLKGLLAVLHAGGDIASYLRQKYNDIMFKKILKETEYEKSLAVYENIFTILLVVAPLLVFIFVLLGEMISPGYMNAMFLLRLLVYVFLPISNFIFIMVLKIFRSD